VQDLDGKVMIQSKGGEAGNVAVESEANRLHKDVVSLSSPAQPAPLCKVVVIPFAELWDYLETEGLEVDYGNHDGELWLKNKCVTHSQYGRGEL
jgi:hypothetical protein